MHPYKKIGLSFLYLIMTCALYAQSSIKPLKVAVFAPVYIDSSFEGMNYKLGNANLSKTILPGLDFYNGILLAVDSLNAEKQSLEVLFYDTKNDANPIELILENKEIQDVSLIIASFNNRNEIKTIADFALEKNIPLISMTYPNDGGITGNPFFALVNPTLKTHIEAIYRYIHRTFATDQITVFKRKGAADDMIAGSFNELNKKTQGLPLKIKTVELTDTFTTAQVFMQLDSTKQNIILCASLNEAFGNNLVKAIASSKKFKAITIGMPTWDGIRDIGKDAEIIYTSPYNYAKTSKIAQQITTNYRNKYFGRPSDMVFKGYEAMYHFGKLLIAYNKNLTAHLSDNSFKLFNEFDFQPVKQKNELTIPDYLENKKLYFIRKSDTQIKSVN
ncbi:MAG: ABC transporter substrate-binding protein [Sphingobacteriia bacterium]